MDVIPVDDVIYINAMVVVAIKPVVKNFLLNYED